MTLTLVFPEAVAKELREMLRDTREAGAVVLARVVENGPDMRLLVREVCPVSDTAYVKREPYELVISSDGYVPALGRAETTETIPIWFHTHPGPGSSPRASKHDELVDRQLADVFRFRSGSRFYGALIFAASDRGGLQFTGFVEDEASNRTAIDRILIVGRRLEMSWHYEQERPAPDAIFDRNIRAFGGEVQAILGALRVAVVGCGGTGSAVCEQLVRLGARHLMLIDPDRLSASNVTRVYGSTPADEGRPKVEVLAGHLRRIAPDVQIETIDRSISLEPVARRLTGVDVIFGCTDDNAGRLVLSRLATFFIVPVFDCGVLLSSDRGGRLDGIFGRVTTIQPGTACLVCRDRIDIARARAELLTPEERKRLADEGYAPALPGIEPAVVTFTTIVAATAVSELLERLTGYGPEPAPTEVLLRLHDREISTNIADPRPRHYCDAATGKIGRGMTTPFLEQVWPAQG